MQSLVVIGAGGFAQEVVWIVDDINAVARSWLVLGYVDPRAPDRKGQSLYDRPILGSFDDIDPATGPIFFACGIGDPVARMRECMEAERRGWQAASLVHPSVVMGRHVEISSGAIIAAGSIVSPYAKIGRHVAINHHVSVGHDSVIGDFSVISPGARISGRAVLEDGVFIGSNGTVFGSRRMGRGATLGANSFLLTNLAPGRSAFGVPARSFMTSPSGDHSDKHEVAEPKG